MPTASEGPAWLSAAVDQRIAFMKHMMGGSLPQGQQIIMTTLTEPSAGENATKADFERWERTCDHCGRYCRPLEDFYTGHSDETVDGQRVMITFGCCPECKEK